MNKFWTLLLLGALFFTACGDDECISSDEECVSTEEIILLEEYLEENNLTADHEDIGVYIVITDAVPDAKSPSCSGTVTVKYKGYELDGSVFDENQNGVVFPLSNLIKGWQVGIPYMKKGEKATLLIPSCLAYGSNPPPGIGVNAPLIFEIELIDF